MEVEMGRGLSKFRVAPQNVNSPQIYKYHFNFQMGLSSHKTSECFDEPEARKISDYLARRRDSVNPSCMMNKPMLTLLILGTDAC